MKINQIGNYNIQAYKQQQNKADQPVKGGSAPSDKVEISSWAKEMQEVSRLENDRQVKVDALKEQVQSGNYTIQAGSIAKSLKQFYHGE
ncbi:flagellar biosynthesis anti-sigma factor FlgM [Rossellomorea marisflavi]|uniref:flagellar biosynthesis anti-sigma factor FlgM n=1 Tax=Rossellomorea marisflavi TaxID=189381 RepID=UPI00345ADDC8